MTETSSEWEQRATTLWAALDETDEAEFLARMETLVAELPVGSAVASRAPSTTH